MSNPAQNPPEAFENLWNAKDVARYLSASRSWVYDQAEAGLLPSLKVGGLLRFVPARVRAWAQGGGGNVLPLKRP